jgi:hypothetical protein
MNILIATKKYKNKDGHLCIRCTNFCTNFSLKRKFFPVYIVVQK